MTTTDGVESHELQGLSSNGACRNDSEQEETHGEEADGNLDRALTKNQLSMIGTLLELSLTSTDLIAIGGAIGTGLVCLLCARQA